MVEIRPHRVYVPTDKSWVEVRSTNFPPALNPYGDIPPETIEVQDHVKEFLDEVKKWVDYGTGFSRHIPDAVFVVDHGIGKDDYGREAIKSEIVFMEYDERRNRKDEVYRYFLYDNNVGIITHLYHDFYEGGYIYETYLMQRFVTREDMVRLMMNKDEISKGYRYPVAEYDFED